MKKYKGEFIESEMAKIILDGRSLWFYDIEEEDDRYELTLSKLDEGAECLANKYPHIIANVIKDGGFDLISADALLQCCLMKDIVFG